MLSLGSFGPPRRGPRKRTKIVKKREKKRVQAQTKSSSVGDLPVETPELRGTKIRQRNVATIDFETKNAHEITARQPPVELPPGVVQNNKGVPVKFKIDRDEHVHISRRGSVDVDFTSERRKNNPPITSRRLLKASSPKTLNRKAKKMIKRVFKKTNTPIRKNGTNGSRPKNSPRQ